MIDVRRAGRMDLGADVARAQRIRRDALDADIDRPAGLQRRMERARTLGLDADHLHLAAEPDRHARDEPAAAGRHQHRIEPARLLLPFECDRALALDRRPSVEGMDAIGAARGLIGFAKRQRIIVARAFDDDLGSELADLRDLRGRRDLRHEDAGFQPERPGREGDRRAMVAARRRRHAGRRDLDRGQRVEGAARLEGSRMLEELELQRQRPARAEGAGGQVEDRRPADMAGDAGMGGADRFAGDRQIRWQVHGDAVTPTHAQIAMGIPCASRSGRAGSSRPRRGPAAPRPRRRRRHR